MIDLQKKAVSSIPQVIMNPYKNSSPKIPQNNPHLDTVKVTKPELYFVELPFKVTNINPTGNNISHLKNEILKKNKVLKLDSTNLPFSDVKLQRFMTPNLAYKKKTYRNPEGETKVVYERIDYGKGFQFKPEYFADFSYQSGIREEGFLKIFEDAFLGKRYLQRQYNHSEDGNAQKASSLDDSEADSVKDIAKKRLKIQNQLNYCQENFCDLFAPSQFAKEFAWVNNNIDIQKEYERETGQLKGRRNNKGRLINSKSSSGNLNQISIDSDEYPVPGLNLLKAKLAKIEGNPLIFYLEVSNFMIRF